MPVAESVVGKDCTDVKPILVFDIFMTNLGVKEIKIDEYTKGGGPEYDLLQH